MTAGACFLTTRDFTILEAMHDRRLGRNDPLAPILKRKLDAATVMFREDIPANVATLGSRVTFSVDGRDPDTRVLSQDRTASPLGMYLPITSLRGLALLGLVEGQEFLLTEGEGDEVRVLLETVQDQPEAAMREKVARTRVSVPSQREPAPRLLRGSCPDRPRLLSAEVGGPENPGASAV